MGHFSLLQYHAPTMDIRIDKQSAMPIYQQIYLHMRSAIAAKEIPAGAKLPSIRKLASKLGVARNTVDTAYRQLRVEGYVRAHQGSGYIVCVQAATQLENSAPAQSNAAPEILLDPIKEQFTYDFSYGDLTPDIFPIEAWRRLSADALSEKNAGKLAAYGGKRGERGLRMQIASFLEQERGVVCRPEQVIVTSGTQQSMSLVLGLFDAAHDIVAMDDPGYDGARTMIAAAGFSLEGIRTDAGEADYISCVEKSRARLLYTTPSHQFPCGWSMGFDTRARLLAHAANQNAFILEDDYDSSYRYDSRPVPALCASDEHDRVILLGSFSKMLSPALRISYLVLPPKLLQRFEQRYPKMRTSVSWIEQATLQRFMESGQISRQLHRARLAYHKRYDVLRGALSQEFDERVKVIGGDAGLFLLLVVNNGLDQEDLIAAACKRDVRVYPTRQFWINPADAPDNLVLLGFSSSDEERIANGIPLLADAWFPHRSTKRKTAGPSQRPF